MAKVATSNPKRLAPAISLTAVVVGIVAGLIAVINFAQAPLPITDPRVLLNGLGTSWSRENFYEALRTGDVRAAEPFLKGGMKINGSTFSAFVTEWFDNKVAAVILANKNAIDPGVCSTLLQVNDPDALALISRGGESGRFVRSICAIAPIRSDLKTKIAIEQQKIQDAQATNTTRSPRIQACVASLKEKFSISQFYDYASKFSIFSVTTLSTAEQIAIADMNAKLLIGLIGASYLKPLQVIEIVMLSGKNPAICVHVIHGIVIAPAG